MGEVVQGRLGGSWPGVVNKSCAPSSPLEREGERSVVRGESERAADLRSEQLWSG